MPTKDPDLLRAKRKRYREKHRDRLIEYKQEWYRERYRNDPEFRAKELAANRLPNEVTRAHRAVGRAIKKGTLVRPDTCEECGTTGRVIEAAHRDYSEPLDVRWLCRRCHRTWDRAEPKSGASR